MSSGIRYIIGLLFIVVLFAVKLEPPGYEQMMWLEMIQASVLVAILIFMKSEDD